MKRPSFHLVVFTDTFLETNGVGSYFRTLLEWSRANTDARLVVICPRHRRTDCSQLPNDIIPIRPKIPTHNPFYRDLILGYYSVSRLSQVVGELPGPKVIHIATSGPLGFTGARVAKRLRLKSVGSYHTDLGSIAPTYGRRIAGELGARLYTGVARQLDVWTYGQCDAMCVPSESAGASVKTFFGREIAVIANPIDLNRFKPAPDRNGAFRARYHRTGRVLAVVVGRLASEKNLDLVCDYLGHDDRIDLVFVGDGPFAGELQRTYGARVTGFLHGEELLAAFQQADVFIQLSENETFGLSLVEAMATGLPAIVLKCTGFVSQVEGTSEPGIEILDRADLPTLADRCVSAVADPKGYACRSRSARELVRHLGADAILPYFIEFHRQRSR